MSDIPKKVEQISLLLQNESSYLQAYEELQKLEMLRVLSLRQAKEIGEHMEGMRKNTNNKRKKERRRKLSLLKLMLLPAALEQEFKGVLEVWNALEQRIFGLMANAAAVAKVSRNTPSELMFIPSLHLCNFRIVPRSWSALCVSSNARIDRRRIREAISALSSKRCNSLLPRDGKRY
jgi:hypothetical protein